MDNELLPPTLSWPKWDWRFNLSLSVISAVIALVIFFFPGFATENSKLQVIRITVGFVFALFPIFVPGFLWCWNAGRVLCQRIGNYPRLHQYAQRGRDELTELYGFVSSYIQNEFSNRAFEITAAMCGHDDFYIILKKRESPKLVEGSRLAAIDTKDGKLMGWFEVTEERSTGYYARNVSHLDIVWKSYVLKLGESHVIPHIIAFLDHQEKRDD
jgi:hypothetical protein